MRNVPQKRMYILVHQIAVRMYYNELLSLPHTFGPLKAKSHKVCKLFLIPDVLRRKHHKTVPHNTTFFDIHWYNRAGIT
jgi:hypothetical protein